MFRNRFTDGAERVMFGLGGAVMAVRTAGYGGAIAGVSPGLAGVACAAAVGVGLGWWLHVGFAQSLAADPLRPALRTRRLAAAVMVAVLAAGLGFATRAPSACGTPTLDGCDSTAIEAVAIVG